LKGGQYVRILHHGAGLWEDGPPPRAPAKGYKIIIISSKTIKDEFKESTFSDVIIGNYDSSGFFTGL